MPRFLEQYGAKAVISPELSDDDLSHADAVVSLYPNKPWKPGQLERIEKYVNDGGTLLIFADHTANEKASEDPDPQRPRWPEEARERFNDLLRHTNMRVRFDTADFAVGGWLQSYETIAHPTIQGVPDDRNEIGVVIGALVDAPLAGGAVHSRKIRLRDPGDLGRPEHAMLSNELYDPGEPLGDVILAAEQRIGGNGGRIIVFGDTSMMSNGLLHGCYDFNSRMLAYISNRTTQPQSLWRQAIAGRWRW